MKKFLFILIFTILYIPTACHAVDLDMTVDDEIRKNYNSSKLMQDVGMTEETLPALPSISNQPKYNKTESKEIYQKPAPKQIINIGNTKIPKGTSFYVVNNSQISDWQKAGTAVKFKSKNNITNKKYSIPANTIFTGEILESHQPQISCNGGLVVIRIRHMQYKGQTIPLNAYITMANSKKVFFNDIKGKRTYLKTVWKKGNWGRSIFNRMLTLTINLGGDGSTLLLSPFPFLYGSLCFGLNAITSPITAFFSKGGHVSIPAGSSFRIKLLDDTYVD